MSGPCAQFIADELQQAVEGHGEGVILTLLQSLRKSHAVRCESTKHGLYVKMLYARSPSLHKSSRQALVLSDLVSFPGGLEAQRHVPQRPVQSPPEAPTDNWCMHDN